MRTYGGQGNLNMVTHVSYRSSHNHVFLLDQEDVFISRIEGGRDTIMEIIMWHNMV